MVCVDTQSCQYCHYGQYVVLSAQSKMLYDRRYHKTICGNVIKLCTLPVSSAPEPSLFGSVVIVVWMMKAVCVRDSFG